MKIEKDVEVKHVCSLGALCHSSQILKRNNYKVCSYPFDWIFSDCDTILHCIKDDFRIFLDKSYYINISKTQCGHSKYHSQMFWHKNPLNNIDHYNYYIRCVHRFKDLLTYREHKLFIMFIPNIENTENENEQIIKITEFNDAFSKYTFNYTLLVIFNKQNQLKNSHVFTYKDNVHFLELHSLSKSNGVEFENKIDNDYLDNIINSTYFISRTSNITQLENTKPQKSKHYTKSYFKMMFL